MHRCWWPTRSRGKYFTSFRRNCMENVSIERQIISLSCFLPEREITKHAYCPWLPRDSGWEGNLPRSYEWMHHHLLLQVTPKGKGEVKQVRNSGVQFWMPRTLFKYLNWFSSTLCCEGSLADWRVVWGEAGKTCAWEEELSNSFSCLLSLPYECYLALALLLFWQRRNLENALAKAASDSTQTAKYFTGLYALRGWKSRLDQENMY